MYYSKHSIQYDRCAGYFCPAMSKAVTTMKKGEKVLLTVKPQCKSQIYLVSISQTKLYSIRCIEDHLLQMHLERKVDQQLGMSVLCHQMPPFT